ncbi:MAG: hypothetical protein U0939_16520 [Pirellulales bacterium]
MQPRDALYALMCASIVGISAYDAFLVFLYRSVIIDFEKNPVGLLLIQLNQGGVSWFLIAKTAGTLFVLGVLVHLYRRYERYAYPVTSTVTAFQVGLVGYLNWS